MDLPKYKKGQRVLFDGLWYPIITAVWYAEFNCLTRKETPIGWKYRLDGYRHDVEEDQLLITPEELYKSL